MWPFNGVFALSYPGLFLTALIAATLLPAQSELMLVAMLATGRFEALWLLVVASAGNVLGSIVNLAIGRLLASGRRPRWFPISDAALERAQRRYRRYGEASLLLSWLPIIGDPLTMIAGVLRMPLPRFLLLVTIAKAGRYAVLMVAHGLLEN